MKSPVVVNCQSAIMKVALPAMLIAAAAAAVVVAVPSIPEDAQDMTKQPRHIHWDGMKMNDFKNKVDKLHDYMNKRDANNVDGRRSAPAMENRWTDLEEDGYDFYDFLVDVFSVNK